MITIFGNKFLRINKLSQLKFLQRPMCHGTSTKKFKEVEISMPWGKLTAKHWGPTDIKPIIAIHGWQDNASSFDPLINYLLEDISLLAIDLPGHGHSSWIAKGCMYDPLIYMQTIERIKHHYGMDKMGIICHSMGGWISFNYACHFPEHMKFIVALDYYKNPKWISSEYFRSFSKQWQHFFQLENKFSDLPRHDRAIAIQNSIKATGNSLNETTCEILFSRGTIEHSDGTISFTRDPRTKYIALGNVYTDEYLKILASRIKFPYRILKGEGCNYNESKESYLEITKVIENHSSDFEYHVIPGRHHFHMDLPEIVAKILNPFIAKYR